MSEMPQSKQHIDAVLRGWEYEPGEVCARLVRGADGRTVLQMRVDMGLLQLETTNRPDGLRPGGAETYFDHLLSLSLNESSDFQLNADQCAEADREFVQFYHRRICWLALREFRRAMNDADHSLAFMDFVRSCSPNEEWTASHEQYRPYILFHRTQAAALAELEEKSPEAAIEAINQGLSRLKAFFLEMDSEEEFDENELVERLSSLRTSLRDHYNIPRTLNEQLADAVATEQFELAARLRDEIAKRDRI